jgi:hypothetical protein
MIRATTPTTCFYLMEVVSDHDEREGLYVEKPNRRSKRSPIVHHKQVVNLEKTPKAEQCICESEQALNLEDSLTLFISFTNNKDKGKVK